MQAPDARRWVVGDKVTATVRGTVHGHLQPFGPGLARLVIVPDNNPGQLMFVDVDMVKVERVD